MQERLLNFIDVRNAPTMQRVLKLIDDIPPSEDSSIEAARQENCGKWLLESFPADTTAPTPRRPRRNATEEVRRMMSVWHPAPPNAESDHIAAASILPLSFFDGAEAPQHVQVARRRVAAVRQRHRLGASAVRA